MSSSLPPFYVATNFTCDTLFVLLIGYYTLEVINAKQTNHATLQAWQHIHDTTVQQYVYAHDTTLQGQPQHDPAYMAAWQEQQIRTAFIQIRTIWQQALDVYQKNASVFCQQYHITSACEIAIYVQSFTTAIHLLNAVIDSVCP